MPKVEAGAFVVIGSQEEEASSGIGDCTTDPKLF